MNQIESTSGNVSILGGLMTALGQCLGWIGENAALFGLMIAFAGLAIQAIVAHANERRKKHEEQRAREEHALRMQVLQAQLADTRS